MSGIIGCFISIMFSIFIRISSFIVKTFWLIGSKVVHKIYSIVTTETEAVASKRKEAESCHRSAYKEDYVSLKIQEEDLSEFVRDKSHIQPSSLYTHKENGIRRYARG